MATNTVNKNNLKQTPIPVVPRTMKIVNADGTVSRSGQLLLEQLQAPSVTEGTHAKRPDPAGIADGALYVESDRGVVYYNDGGVWKYLAGTMWGTLVPDQRPTDLGPNDAGFIFHSTDYGREFVWNGTAWIEATLVRWGSHAERLALNLTHVIDAELFVESDRSNVMYQNHGGVWQFVTGTMWGTLVPDQRPTDLGSHDVGFTFRGTDYAREFIWNGTTWIDATLVRWGSHAGRLALVLTTVIDQELYVESDRSNVLYQNQGGVWHFVTGTMWGTISPDQRPTDLGANDTGFQFGATDTKQIYRWNGTAWVLWTGASDMQLAASSGSLTLTTTRQDISGAQLTLANAGIYIIRGVFDMNVFGSGDQNQFLFGGLNFNGSDLGMVADLLTASTTGIAATVAQQWLVTASAPGQIAKLRAWKGGGTGTSYVGAQTTISAECLLATAGGSGGGGAVTSVFARSGNVIAQTGDYSAAQVTNAVSTIGSYADPAWITSLSWSKITGAPATGVSSVFGRTGAVVAAAGDYTAAQVTNAVSTASTYADPAWITSLSWSKLTGIPATVVSPLTTKGDIHVFSTVDTRLPVGSNNQMILADSTQTLGVKWAVPTAAMITNAVDSTATYANPAWITSLAWTKITGTPSVGSYQTPWLQNIAGATFTLTNVSQIGIGQASAAVALDVLGSWTSGGTGGPVNVKGTAATCYLKLDTTTAGTAGIIFGSAGTYQGEISAFGNQITIYSSTSVSAIVVASGGNVGIKNTSPTAQLTVGAAAVNSSANFFQFGYGQAKTNTALTRVGTLAQSNEASQPFALNLAVLGAAADANRIAELQTGVEGLNNSGNLALQPWGGNVGIGLSNSVPTYQLQLATDSAGKPSTTTWTVSSDIRTKRNVQSFQGGLEIIRLLNPIVAEYNGLAGTPEGARVVGFNAQELRGILPQCVSGSEETGVLGVNIHEILFHMLRAIQQIDWKLRNE